MKTSFMKMKKVLILLIVLAMAIGIASCNTPATPAASDPADTPAASGSEGSEGSEGGDKSNLELSLERDAQVVTLVGTDGQPLIFDYVKEFPARPDDPESLPDEDPQRWYDFEYAGWSQEKTNIPESPKDGSIGKNIIMIIHGEHPYYTAYANAATTIAETYGMNLKILWPNWDLSTQNQMVEQAINEKPDLIILLPLDVEASAAQFKKVNDAGIPIIAAHQLVNESALQYCLAWTGPDEWMPRRELAVMGAEAIGGKGQYAIMSHNPGGSTFFSRSYGYISTIYDKYPDMECMEIQSPGFDAANAKQLMSDWIKKYGDDLKLVFLAGDSDQGLGAVEACEAAGRDDIIIITAGNSKVGMDYLQEGKHYASNVESPEACAATAVKSAADFFNGKELKTGIYVPDVVITPDTVGGYYPAQW